MSEPRRNIVVTGAAGGIGRAIAGQLARLGFGVGLIDLRCELQHRFVLAAQLVNDLL